VVKTYELPSKPKGQAQADSEPGGIRQGLTRMGTGLGFSGKHESGELSKAGASSSPRQSMLHMGSLAGWGFGGKNQNTDAEGQHEDDEEDDDRRIRFTIGGAGRRLTKDAFLKEMQSLDPKSRVEVIEDSDAPAALKAMAQRDADKNSPGSSRLFSANATGAKTVQAASGKGTAHAVGAEMARRKVSRVEEGSSDEGSPHTPRRRMRGLSKVSSAPDREEEETAAERMRREKAMRGVEDSPSPPRGRVRRDSDRSYPMGSEISPHGRKKSTEVETQAEKRRREAALGVSLDAQEDSDDDDTPRIPPPAAKPRGIRFAQSPARDERGQRGV